ncbi:MAG: hypothetical protein HOP07_17575 [Bacteriovoracaceae bacterium]|nr:hypothetical protein [Bacteriovoracaceae bacterium]NOT80799.1 hypothetical protein [Bacteriovoracaceae bacterium]
MSESDWLEKEFKNIEFGDKRLRDRFFSMANIFHDVLTKLLIKR